MPVISGSSRGPPTGFGGGVVALVTVGVIAGGLYLWSIPGRKLSQTSPPRYMEKNLEEIKKSDGKLERSIRTPEGYEYFFSKCYNTSDNPDTPKIVCLYSLVRK